MRETPQPIRAKHRDSPPGIMKFERLSKADVVYALALAIASLIAYVLIYYILEPFANHPNDLLGGMWATIATVFVFKDSRDRSLRAAIVRFSATCISCVLTLVYCHLTDGLADSYLCDMHRQSSYA